MVEATYWKSSPKSQPLFGVVLQLKMLEMKYELVLHVIHIGGKKMKRQGTDSLSSDSIFRGVLSGKPMTFFVPLDSSFCLHEPNLET